MYACTINPSINIDLAEQLSTPSSPGPGTRINVQEKIEFIAKAGNQISPYTILSSCGYESEPLLLGLQMILSTATTIEVTVLKTKRITPARSNQQ